MGQLIGVEGGVVPALLDRALELASVTGWLSEARHGRGRFAVVLGGAGLGKTAFLQRSVALARAQGLVALTARGGELERDMPFGVARQLFEKTIRELPPAAQRKVLSGPAAGVRSLLGMVDGGVATADPLGAIHAMYWLLANLSDHAALALVIDDLHWADPQTVRWLRYLTGRVAELPVLILAATRPTHPSGGHRMPEVTHPTEMIGLRPLDVGAVGEMVRHQFNRAGEDGFISACHDATGDLTGSDGAFVYVVGSTHPVLKVINRFAAPATGVHGEDFSAPPWWAFPGKWGVQVAPSVSSNWTSATTRVDTLGRSWAYWNTVAMQRVIGT
jgi:hypothetical protein